MINILIADDESSIRTLIQATLEGPECRIVQASNGADALRLANGEKFEIIVLDWMMPGMNGIEVLPLLRENPQSSRTPVIMLTARGQSTDQEHAVKLGAAAYIMKPFSPLELLSTIQKVLKRSGNSLGTAQEFFGSSRKPARAV